MDRRIFLYAAISSLIFSDVRGSSLASAKQPIQQAMAQLEKEFGGRIGFCALDTGNNQVLGYRADERFALCSTFKLFVAAAILEKSARSPGFMHQTIRYSSSDTVRSGYAPITTQHLDSGLTVTELCAAAIEYSDNCAANLLLKILGGPAGLTKFARSMGDYTFRLDHWEPELNEATPGDLQDTSTPRAMTLSTHRLVLGNVLGPAQREQLVNWLLASTTGTSRIRAGVPSDWKVGDKTGTGDYGVANDVAVLWPPQRAPIVMAIYTAQSQKKATARSEVVARCASLVLK